MKMTSSQASKLLRQLNDELRTLAVKEENGRSFIASLNEDPESVRPDYNYEEIQKQIMKTEEKICKLKHTINVFNTTTVIPEFDMTIDMMLVYMPQLSRRVEKLMGMKDVLPKARVKAVYNSQIIDYCYANYDIKQVETDYIAAVDELGRAQNALDYINNTVEFEVNI